MTALVTSLQAFFTDRLIRNAKPARIRSLHTGTPCGCWSSRRRAKRWGYRSWTSTTSMPRFGSQRSARSELIGLQCADVHLGAGAHVSCLGKGRKQRITPLTSGIIAVLRVWLAERAGQPTEPLFTTQAGMALSRDALEHRLAKYVEIAARTCPSLGQKTITMHVLRHTAAMRLLRAGIDTSVIALWLGHEQIETTQIYLHADLQLKERALAKTTPANITPGRYRPSDKLLAFLEAL
jgi:integrase/recombinase XerD